MGIVSLKEDYVFKEFMSIETVRKYFLSATLGVPVEQIRSARLMNTFLSRRWRTQKQGILDVQVEFNNDTKVNLEMQVAKKKDWRKRNLFYLAKMYTDDIRWGEDYGRLRRCIGISILDFDLTDSGGGHNVYRMRNTRGEDFSDMMELHIIELRKAFSPEDSLAEWVKLFNVTTEEELDMIKSNNMGIQMGIEAMRKMSLTRRIRLEIEAREKARRDRVAEIEYIKDELRAQGWQEGREEGREEERNLINGLYSRLVEDDRIEDLKRATREPEYLQQLMTEYDIHPHK